MENDPLISLKGMGLEEYSYLKQVVSGMNPRQTQNFILLYRDRRKDPQEILLFTLLGFLGVAGIQRLIIGVVGMGILYFLLPQLKAKNALQDNHFADLPQCRRLPLQIADCLDIYQPFLAKDFPQMQFHRIRLIHL